MKRTNRSYTFEIPEGILETTGYISIRVSDYKRDFKPQYFFNLNLTIPVDIYEETTHIAQFHNGRLISGDLEDRIRLIIMRQLSFPEDSTKEQRKDYSAIYQTLRVQPKLERRTNRA
jgi:hypothetical protein